MIIHNGKVCSISLFKSLVSIVLYFVRREICWHSGSKVSIDVIEINLTYFEVAIIWGPLKFHSFIHSLPLFLCNLKEREFSFFLTISYSFICSLLKIWLLFLTLFVWDCLILRTRNPPKLVQIPLWGIEKIWCISQNPVKGSISEPGRDRSGNWLRSDIALPVSILFCVSFSLLLQCPPHREAFTTSFLFPSNFSLPWYHFGPSCIAVLPCRIEYCLTTVSRGNPASSSVY